MKQIFLATNNKGKQKEFVELLRPFNIDVKFPQDIPNYVEPEETAETFLENALIKARYGAEISGLPCISDDSGLCVKALNGAPGVYSARYAGKGDNAANNQKLMQVIKTVPANERQAFYACVLVLVRHQDDPMPMVFQATWDGIILDHQQGEGGFGYDPLFFLPELNKTAAQLPSVDKNRLSHRAQAMQKLLQFLSSRPV